MIHHLARALAVREASRGVRVTSTGGHAHPAPTPRAVRIHRDPTDARRTVIAGRFADVCAALDRMAAELEPA